MSFYADDTVTYSTEHSLNPAGEMLDLCNKNNHNVSKCGVRNVLDEDLTL